jgi:folate-dependent phosphoribosylglycinamide formyltransferase PurN
MQNNNDNISDSIAYITINPKGKFLKSVQLGFQEVGLQPKYLIHVNPGKRLLSEFKKYRLGIFKKFIIPKFFQHSSNKASFSNEIVSIPIAETIFVKKLNSDELVKILQEKKIKYLVNCGAGIFRKKLIDCPNLNIINAHAGKLPLYRNMNVVDWALYNNEPVIGTVHLVDTGIDTGNILYEEPLNLGNFNDIITARESAFDQVAKILGKVVLAFSKGEITPKIQTVEGRNWYIMHDYFKSIYQQRINK